MTVYKVVNALPWLVCFTNKERGLSRKTKSSFNFICQGDFLVKVSASYQIYNNRNKKVHFTKVGQFSPIFLVSTFWMASKTSNLCMKTCKGIEFQNVCTKI